MGFQKWVVNIMFKFPNFIEVVAEIIKIARSIADDPPQKKTKIKNKNKNDGALQQWVLRGYRYQAK